MNCPLCRNNQARLFHKAYSPHSKTEELFHKCSNCFLVYKDSQHYLSSTEEKKRYDEHNNDPNDSRYIEYLTKAVTPLLPFLKKGDQGLDFGCGPGPTLSNIFQEHGYQVVNYDPYYANDKSLLKKQYQFITSTEVFEHLNYPYQELELLKKALTPGGYLCLMTQIYSKDIDFGKWWYKNDPTHIVFYQKKTFEWIASRYQLSLKLIDNNIIILKNEELVNQT